MPATTTSTGYPTEGMAANAPTGPHQRMTFQRRALGPKDVAIKIHYVAICHSDIHTIHGDWGPVTFPQIVGHEITGDNGSGRLPQHATLAEEASEK